MSIVFNFDFTQKVASSIAMRSALLTGNSPHSPAPSPKGRDTLCQVALTMSRQGETTGHLMFFRSDALLVEVM